MSLEGGVGGAAPNVTVVPPTGTGATQVQGTAAAGVPPVGNPVLDGLTDGTNVVTARAAGFTPGAASNAIVPTGTPVIGSSGNQANTAAVATLPAAVGKTTYITGFQCAASGATAGLPVVITLTGLLSSNMSFAFTFPAGILVGATPLVVTFGQPIPASAVNTAIVLTLPAGGAGNTNATATSQGFQL